MFYETRCEACYSQKVSIRIVYSGPGVEENTVLMTSCQECGEVAQEPYYESLKSHLDIENGENVKRRRRP
jgi:uncharacterized Zn finger protein